MRRFIHREKAMNVLSRLTELISVNVHALLDKAENPERMLAHLLRTLEEGFASARVQAAGAIVAERQLRRELDQCRASAEHWQEHARCALAQGRDDLARQALARRIDQEGLMAALEVQHHAAHELSVEVKAALHALRDRLADARRRQSLLVARRRAAQVRLELQRARGAGNVAACFSRLEQFERRLEESQDDMLAQVELGNPDDDLEAGLENLERDRRIEEELQALRSSVDRP